MAEVEMDIDGVTIMVKAATSETLPVSVLLGRDVKELGQLLGRRDVVHGEHGEAMVVTRAQALRGAEEEACRISKEKESGIQAKPIAEEKLTQTDDNVERVELMEEEPEMQILLDGEQVQSSEEEVAGGTFADELFQRGRVKKRLSRSEKRKARHEVGLERAKDKTQQTEGTNSDHMDRKTLCQLQRSDETLTILRKRAGNLMENKVFWRDGVLYTKGTQGGKEVEQIVLPKWYRRRILELAHKITLGGHLGRKKTTLRVMRRFYWPTVFRDVADFCNSCATCQKYRRYNQGRAPMMPLPVVGVPFQLIAMDIVGPLPRSRSGNRYILVVCDYATRYPEAIPLRTIDAEVIAQELMKIFARVGIPKEILTDQGSNFQSQLLAELYRLLHIGALRTSPYHPQTDGLVERFNKTLKDMLKKTASEEGKDWDRLIPFLLFLALHGKNTFNTLRQCWAEFKEPGL